MKMQCILADDEPLARKGMENFIRDVPFLELAASCNSALEVIDSLSTIKADLLFLDIQMPKMTGMSLLRNTSGLPPTIITTAYPNYALESYELSVIDYLLKPIPFDRFMKAVTKAKDYHELIHHPQENKELDLGYCFIKCDKSYEKLFYTDILYIEAMLNYVVIHTEQKKFISYLTLKSLEDQLPATLFLKINKSFIVNKNKINSIEANEIVIKNHRLQIGRSFKDAVMDILLEGKLIRRT